MFYLYYDDSYGINLEEKYGNVLDKLNIKITKDIKHFHIFLTLYVENLKQTYINICHFKDIFVKKMIESNLCQYIPNTFFSEPKKFPIILKPKNGMAGLGIKILFSKSEYKKRYLHNYILQEFIYSSDNHVAHLLCQNGKIVWNIIYYSKKSEIYEIKKGRLINYKKRNMNDIEIFVFSKIMEILNYHGVCSIDYVYNRDNNQHLKIFEINPRFGGSLVYDENDFPFFLEKIIEEKIYFKNI